MTFTIRPATADDAEFLTTMLMAAVNWLPDRNFSRERILREPDTAHYVTGWPRPTDLGVIAIDEDGQPIGAAWLRLFTEDDQGYGFVATDVPELSIGVMAEWRGRGVGRALLERLHERAEQTGMTRISLSVERTNPAIDLYRSLGYRTVASGRDSDPMVRGT